jgi:serine phosphatase RsbU (regulator of sigma subunit)
VSQRSEPPRPAPAGDHRQQPAGIDRQLSALTQIGRTMVSHFDYEHALAAVIEKTAEILDSKTGAFMLYDEAAGVLAVQRPAFGVRDEAFESAYRVSLSEGGNAVEVFVTGEAYMTNSFRTDPRMNQRFVSMTTAERVMTVPLQVEGRSIGVFHVQDKRSGDYTSEDLELLKLMAPTLAVLIMSAALMRELRDSKQQLEAALALRKRQLERAARIQRELLPQTTPELDGYQLAAACFAADDVAGDFYDWMDTDGGTLTFTVADVMGKGIGASLVMASLRAALRAAPAGLGPAARIRLAEHSMALGTGEEGLFVTVFHGQLHLSSRELRYVDAGHGYCTIRRPGGELVRLTEHSLPLGVVPDADYREGMVRLERGETLIVHSDGLVESEGGRTGSLDEFASEMSEAANARDMVRRLLGRIPFQLHDDVTILVLRCLPASPPQGRANSQLLANGGTPHGNR